MECPTFFEEWEVAIKITKFGHCCLLVEEKGLRILTDPGDYSTQQNSIKNIDVILITHEHQDHFHVESVRALMKNNPHAQIVTNTAVGRLLDQEKIEYQVVEDTQSTTISELTIEGFGTQHAEIYPTYQRVQNTGYFIANKLFYPGDCFFVPSKPVDILALPVAGPWLKISEAIDYCIDVHPRVVIPVHDGVLVRPGLAHRLSSMVLTEREIQFIALEIDKPTEFA